METSTGKLIILDSVDSTNNYAMGLLHEGLANDGDAWLALEQTSGKGRLSKGWHAEKGKNILMSMIIKPVLPLQQQFQLSMAVAVACQKLLTKYIDDIKIKWPNDLYWQDRKAGGILIENIVQGNRWQWSVAGIGINVNQTAFDNILLNPVSLKQITSKDFDVQKLALELQLSVKEESQNLFDKGFEDLYNYYNEHLYKAGETVWLKKENARFQTTIKKVTADGFLEVEDVIERRFASDEITWEIGGGA